METAPQKNGQGFRVGIVGAILITLISFFIGVYVGLHPMWIPINTSNLENPNKPTDIPPGAPSPRGDDHPATAPQTLPTTNTSQ